VSSLHPQEFTPLRFQRLAFQRLQCDGEAVHSGVSRWLV
jgi:hypothetical protein